MSFRLEHRAVAAMVDGVGQRQPHQARRADRAVEPRAGHHLDDVGDAAAFLADQPAVRLLELHLRGGIRAVAELVLQPLQAQRIDGAVRQEARHQEAGEAARRLRQHQEGVAHGRRHEPLVPGDDVFRPWSAGRRPARPTCCWRARRCRPASRSCPCRWWRRAWSRTGAKLLSYSRDRILGSHCCGDVGLQQQRRHRRVGHGDGALVAGLHLDRHVGAGGAGDVGAWQAAWRRRSPAWSHAEQCRPSAMLIAMHS